MSENLKTAADEYFDHTENNENLGQKYYYVSGNDARPYLRFELLKV